MLRLPGLQVHAYAFLAFIIVGSHEALGFVPLPAGPLIANVKGSCPRWRTTVLGEAIPNDGDGVARDDPEKELVGLEDFYKRKAEREKDEWNKVANAFGGGGSNGGIFPSDMSPPGSDEIRLQAIRLDPGQPQVMAGFWQVSTNRTSIQLIARLSKVVVNIHFPSGVVAQLGCGVGSILGNKLNLSPDSAKTHVTAAGTHHAV